MIGTLRRTLEALLIGCATYLGIFLAMELRDPYSNVRLRLDAALDRIREVKKR